MKVLIIHPGATLNRHSNMLKIIALGLKKKHNCDLTWTDFRNITFADDTRSGLGSMPESAAPLSWYIKRDLFGYKYKKQFDFCDNSVKLKKYINEHELNDINVFLNSMPRSFDVNYLINIRWKNIKIGADIWSSVQRYCFIGKPKNLIFKKNSILYEYIKSGLIISTVFENLFSKSSYDAILINEVTYINWGIPLKFALKHNVKVIAQSHGYLGKKHLGIVCYDNINEPIIPSGSPKDDELKRIYNNSELRNKYLQIFYKRFGQSLSNFEYAKNNLSEFTPDVKLKKHKVNVAIFTHLCWDATLGYGHKVFETFEDWIKETFIIAEKLTEINWIFKVHPHEIHNDLSPRSEITSSEINTYTFLKDLLYKSNAKNIFISTIYDNINLIPHLDCCISVLGTCRYEMASLGIPVILAEKTMSKNNGFTVCANSVKDYKKLLMNISSINISEKEIELARIYSGIYYDPERYINVEHCFDDDDFEKDIPTYRLKLFLNDNKNIDKIDKLTSV